MENGFLTVNEVAEMLKVDIETVYRWLKTGKLPGAKVGGAWRIRKSDIDNMFEMKSGAV